MDRMTEYITRAASELGLAIAAPFRCEIGNGTEVVAVAHLPELGAVNGTLVFRSSQFDREIFDILKSRGFACTSFGDPLDSEQYDLEGYREMFADWTWTSTAKEPPHWIMSEECDDE